MAVDNIIIIAGDHDTTLNEHDENRHRTEQRMHVLEMYTHPKHGTGGRKFNYDFCLLRTEKMDLNGRTASTVCLPTQSIDVNFAHVTKSCYIAGWGLLNSNGPGTTVLQSVDVEVYTDDMSFLNLVYYQD